MLKDGWMLKDDKGWMDVKRSYSKKKAFFLRKTKAFFLRKKKAPFLRKTKAFFLRKKKAFFLRMKKAFFLRKIDRFFVLSKTKPSSKDNGMSVHVFKRLFKQVFCLTCLKQPKRNDKLQNVRFLGICFSIPWEY